MNWLQGSDQVNVNYLEEQKKKMKTEAHTRPTVYHRKNQQNLLLPGNNSCVQFLYTYNLLLFFSAPFSIPTFVFHH